MFRTALLLLVSVAAALAAEEATHSAASLNTFLPGVWNVTVVKCDDAVCAPASQHSVRSSRVPCCLHRCAVPAVAAPTRLWTSVNTTAVDGVVGPDQF